MLAASNRLPSAVNGVNRSATTPSITCPLSTLRSFGADGLAAISLTVVDDAWRRYA